MNWAEHDREREEREYLMPKHPAIRDVRNCAAAELFCLTGESKWNSLFLETTPYKNSAGAVEYTWDSLDQADCAWVYARADRLPLGEAPLYARGLRGLKQPGERHLRCPGSGRSAFPGAGTGRTN